MRISIITPSYQQASFIQETLDSVHDTAKNVVEHIVVDGGSTDGSKEIIERNAQHLAWWCSENDKGQSNAINKGLTHASGNVFNWLNSDDLLTANALEIISKEFENNNDLLVLCGGLIHRTADGDSLFSERTDATDSSNFYINHVVSQPATWFRMSVVESIGGVEEKLKYVMDYELWLQFIFRFGTKHIKQVDEPLAIFRIHADSKTTISHASFIDEMASILKALCRSTNNLDLCEVLESGYEITNGLRHIPANEQEHKEIVRRMVLRFLFKWNGTIYKRKQFKMMKMLIANLDPFELDKDAFSRARYNALLSDLAVPTWNMFRIKRKLGF